MNRASIRNFAVLSLASLSSAYSFVGCYSEPGELVPAGSYQFQSLGYCQQACDKRNQTVFALHNGDACYCGLSLPSAEAQVPAAQCNTPCAGFPSETCGGSDTWSVNSDSLSVKRDDADSVIVTAPDTSDPVANIQVNPTLVETVIALASSVVSDAEGSVPQTAIPSVILTAPTMTAAQQQQQQVGSATATAASLVIVASTSPSSSPAAASSSASARPSASAGAAAGLDCGAGRGSLFGGVLVSFLATLLY
ncbi:WSC domain-containing protein [Aspergillus saccharolyticus JOP 1030-1]|uniref:WSC-domain-containing protein n=1 Tax=Aspergillus saccharolyticus JOP 1030-1 TaxID=1450539 RepID=A0A318ZJP6_9EURO|nr:WSC-domain-containing protein [Aspergillus saccharolyticus JOP 1030-1]PYH47801.1 WSC-domain-containing protein [Aspergillus saccharolyticus JOP 1030-1]